MGTSYGREIHKVVAADIDTVTYQYCTLLTNDNSGNHNTYVLKLQFNTGGCGGNEPGGNITINNLVEGWRWEYITWKSLNKKLDVIPVVEGFSKWLPYF